MPTIPLPVPQDFTEHPVHKGMATHNMGTVIRRFKTNWRLVKPQTFQGAPRINVRKDGTGVRTKMLLAEFVLEAHGRPCPDPTYRPFHRNGNRRDCRIFNLDWRPYSSGGYRLKPLGEPECLKWVDEEKEPKRLYTVLDSSSVRILFVRFTTTNDSLARIALDLNLSYEAVRSALRGKAWKTERRLFGLHALEQAAARRGVSVVKDMRTQPNA